MALLLAISWLFVLLKFNKGQTLPQQTLFTLAECGTFPKYQMFTQNNSSGSYSVFKITSYSGSCIDDNYAKPGTGLWVYDCDPNQVNQRFTLVSTSNANNVILRAQTNGKTCPQASSSLIYSSISMQDCQTTNILQQWNIKSNGYIVSASNSSLCLTVGMSSVMPNCTMAPLNTYPYCNQQLPTRDRVKDLVSRMTLSEKVQNLGSTNPGVPRLGIAKNLYHEALHGVLCG
eukprot:408381_1